MGIRTGLAASAMSCAVGALPGFVPANPATAQPMYKCLKGNAVTYSNTPCDQLGLASGGQVRDRMTTLPSGVPPPPKGAPAAGAKPQPAAGRENEIDMPKTSTTKPVNPMIEKLAK